MPVFKFSLRGLISGENNIPREAIAWIPLWYCAIKFVRWQQCAVGRKGNLQCLCHLFVFYFFSNFIREVNSLNCKCDIFCGHVRTKACHVESSERNGPARTKSHWNENLTLTITLYLTLTRRIAFVLVRLRSNGTFPSERRIHSAIKLNQTDAKVTVRFPSLERSVVDAAAKPQATASASAAASSTWRRAGDVLKPAGAKQTT